MDRKSLLLLMVVASTIGTAGTSFGQILAGRARYDPDGIQLFGCDLSADGRYLLVGGDSIRVYHAASGDLLQQLRPNLRPRGEAAGLLSIRHFFQLIMRNQWTRKIKFSPVLNDVYATAGDDGVVRIWRVSQPQPLHVLAAHKGRVTVLEFSPDGQLLASGGSRTKRTNSIDEINVWDVARGKLLQSDNFYNDGVNCVSFFDNNTVAFSRNDDKEKRDSVIEFYDVATWRVVRRVPFTPGKAYSLVFSADRQRLIITGGECIRLGAKNCRPTGYLWIADLGNDKTGIRIETDPAQRIKTRQCGYFNHARSIASTERFATETSLVNGPQVVDYVQMRNSIDGSLIWSTKCGTSSMQGFAVSRDGKQVVYCAIKEIRFLDAETGKQFKSIEVR